MAFAILDTRAHGSTKIRVNDNQVTTWPVLLLVTEDVGLKSCFWNMNIFASDEPSFIEIFYKKRMQFKYLYHIDKAD